MHYSIYKFLSTNFIHEDVKTVLALNRVNRRDLSEFYKRYIDKNNDKTTTLSIQIQGSE